MKYHKNLSECVFIRSHGVTIRLRTNSREAPAAIIPAIEANLPGCEIFAGHSDMVFDHDFVYVWNRLPLDGVYKNDEKIDNRRRRETAVPLLASQIRLCVAEFSPKFTFVHAGVVAIEGKAVILPAKSFHGKTTLTAELVRKGAIYYSDEYAVIDKNGHVHPFPKDLSMRGIIDDRQQVDIPVKEFGGRTGKKPLPAGLLLFTEYSEKARWRPRPLTPGYAFLELVNHTVPIRQNAPLAMETLGKLVQAAESFKTRRGEATKAAESILAMAYSRYKDR